MSLCGVEARGKRRAIRHVILVFLLHFKIKMAYDQVIFEQTMFGAPTQAESELTKEKINDGQLTKALKERNKFWGISTSVQ